MEGLIRFFQLGGSFMYPLLGILAIASAIVIERFVILKRSNLDAKRLWKQIAPVLRKSQLDDALKQCSGPRFQKPLHLILAAGIKGIKTGYDRDAMRGALVEETMEITPRLEARLHYLPNLANVATLLGLLGTIIGLIEAFTAVAVADPSQKAVLLAKGISMAMNTTAFGLVVAIPIMLVYTYLQSRTNTLIASLDEYALKFLNLAALLRKSPQPAIAPATPSTRHASTSGGLRGAHVPQAPRTAPVAPTQQAAKPSMRQWSGREMSISGEER